MTQVLFVISLATFALSGAMWFIVWAVWIHANTGAYGPAPEGYATVMAEAPDPAIRRRFMWYGRLKRLTLILLAVSILLGVVVLGGGAE